MLCSTINTTRILSSSAFTESSCQTRPAELSLFDVPVEINEQIVQYLPLREQMQFRLVSKKAANIGWSVLNSEFKYVFDSLQKIWRFLDDAQRYAKRSAEQIEQALLILSSLGAESPVKPLVPASARLKEPIHDYPEDAAFDQALREAGILPDDLDFEASSRDWLRTPRNFLGILRWVPVEDMHKIMSSPSPLARRFQDVLKDLKVGDTSPELPLAMLKDDTGIDLGITENCNYLCEVVEFGWAAPNNPQTANLALMSMEIEIATILLEKGVNIDAYNAYRESGESTALNIASEEGYDEMVAFLIDKGANVDARNEKGETSLWLAVATHRLEIVKLLLGARADPNLFPFDSVTPLEVARQNQNGHTEVIRLLEAFGGRSRKDLDTDWQRRSGVVAATSCI